MIGPLNWFIMAVPVMEIRVMRVLVPHGHVTVPM
jgi:hypothetical protein